MECCGIWTILLRWATEFCELVRRICQNLPQKTVGPNYCLVFLIDHIMDLAHLPVCLSGAPTVPTWKQKDVENPKLVWTLYEAGITGVPVFNLELLGLYSFRWTGAKYVTTRSVRFFVCKKCCKQFLLCYNYSKKWQKCNVMDSQIKHNLVHSVGACVATSWSTDIVLKLHLNYGNRSVDMGQTLMLIAAVFVLFTNGRFMTVSSASCFCFYLALYLHIFLLVMLLGIYRHFCFLAAFPNFFWFLPFIMFCIHQWVVSQGVSCPFNSCNLRRKSATEHVLSVQLAACFTPCDCLALCYCNMDWVLAV